jgi:hypothetical protein
LAHINEELAKGLEVEREHFNDFKERTRVAKDHLVENPNYYTILEKAGLEDGGKIKFNNKLNDDNLYFVSKMTYGVADTLSKFIRKQEAIDYAKSFFTSEFINSNGKNLGIRVTKGESKEDLNNQEYFITKDGEHYVYYAKDKNEVEDILKSIRKKINNDSNDYLNYARLGSFKDTYVILDKINDFKKPAISSSFKKGGHIQKQDLVENSKKGDTPARDLNNYNDLLDVQADSNVGADNGLAFANGGLTPYDANLEGDSVSVLNTGGGVGLPKVAYTLVSNAGASLPSLLRSRYNSYKEFKESVEEAYKPLLNRKPILRSFVELEAYDENGKKLMNASTYIADQKNTVKNFNPTTGNYRNLEKSLANSRPRIFQKFDWEDWLTSKVKTSTVNSQTPIASSFPEYYEFSQEVNTGFTKGKIYKIKNPNQIGASGNFIDDVGKVNGYGSNNSSYFKPSTEQAFLAQQGMTSANSNSNKQFDFTDTKIDVRNNNGLSLRVQKKAFESGWEWENGAGKTIDYSDINYLYFTKKSISDGFTQSSFINSPKREITEAEIFGSQTPNITSSTTSAQSSSEKDVQSVLVTYAGGQQYVALNEEKLLDKIVELWKSGGRSKMSIILQPQGFVTTLSSPVNVLLDNFSNKLSNTIEPSYISIFELKELLSDNWFSELNWSLFFKDVQTTTSNSVVPKTADDEKFTDFKEVVGKLEGFASQASKKYNTPKYEDSLQLFKEVKEEYSLALSFTPESSFMYERIELMKKINEVQKEITRITELKNGGAYYILAKVIDRLEKGENWKDLGVGEIMINEVPEQEIESVIYTEKFKNWFGNWEEALITKEYDYVSKALTANGKPSVMFHGAKRIKYSYRQVSNGVLYLAENRSYAEWFSANESPYQKQGDYLTQCFVNLKNPIDLTVFGVEEVDLRDIIQFIDTVYPLAKIYDVLPPNTAMAIMNNQLIGRNFRAWYIIRQFPELNKHIRDNTDYDGFIYYENNPSDIITSEINGEMQENVTKATAVFNSNQVKLVDAMLFDASLDDWRFEQGGKVNQ